MKETLAIPSVALFIAYSQFESKGKVFMDKWVRDVYNTPVYKYVCVVH